MNLEKKLIKLLDQYIKQMKLSSSSYEINLKKKNMYEDLINLLDRNYDTILENQGYILSLLNQLSQNNQFYQDFQELISNIRDIKTYIYNIRQEYQEIINSIKEYELQAYENSKILESTHRVKNSLKYNKPINSTEEDIDNIAKVLRFLSTQDQVKDVEVLLYLNLLEYHNERMISKKDLPEQQEITEFRYNELPNIINAGFQEHDVVEVSIRNKANLDFDALELIEQIKSLSEESNQNQIETQMINVINHYKDKNLPENEFNYVILKMLDEYLEELLELYKLLLDKDVYINKNSKEEVITEYYKVLNQYIIINRYYNRSIDFTKEEKFQDTTEEHTEKRLIYSRSETNIIKSKIIHDMSNISYEYYHEIFELLQKFKNGTLGNKKIKTILHGSNSSGHIELKNDSIRIILKRVKDNIYNVLGVFIKKANNDMSMYAKVINRITPNIDTTEQLEMQLELSKQTEVELEQLVNEKGRTNGR